MNDSVEDRPIELVSVINSFNRRPLLERAVSSLMLNLRDAPFRSAAIVFEAGSNDGSREFLDSWREQHPADDLTVITPSGERSSFADGVNAGCRAALARFPDCRWLFLYETDNCLEKVEPVSKAISLLALEPQIAAVGFTVKQHNGSFFGYGMRFPRALSLALGQHLTLRWSLDSPTNSPWQMTDHIRWRTCDVVFTSPLLVRRQAWEQTGGFDATNFPFSESDLDWAWRCAKLGWKMAVIASEDVIHDNLEQRSAWSANRVIDFHRNRLRLLKRHRGRRVGAIKPILFVRHCLEIVGLACRGRTDPAAKEKLAKRRQLLRTVWSDYS